MIFFDKKLKSARAIFKVASMLVKNQVITPDEYASSYNSISDTYSVWNSIMGEYTKKLIEQYPPQKDEKILDFACGNGFLSKELININPFVNITGIDISENLIEQCKKDIKNKKIDFVANDGLKFLDDKKSEFDRIYSAWALPYFDNNQLLSLFNNSLKNDGMVFIISNSVNTLKNLDKVFKDVILKYPDNLKKIMKISPNLPNGKSGLKKKFEENGFETIYISSGEEIVIKDTASGLYKWLKSSGVLAGTEEMFTMNDEIKNAIIKAIEKKLSFEKKYKINHKFVAGIFRKRI